MSILGRMDDMGTRIDDLEKSIVALMDQAGIERDSSSLASAQQTIISSLPTRSEILINDELLNNNNISSSTSNNGNVKSNSSYTRRSNSRPLEI